MSFLPQLFVYRHPWWRRPFARGRGALVPLLANRGEYWRNRCRNAEALELACRANWHVTNDQLERAMIGLRAVAALSRPEHLTGSPASMLEEIGEHVERAQLDILNIGARGFHHV